MTTATLAKDLRAGQVIVHGVYEHNEPMTVLVTHTERTENSLGEWYDSDKADTLDTLTTNALRVWYTTLDGKWSDCFLVSESELVAVVE